MFRILDYLTIDSSINQLIKEIGDNWTERNRQSRVDLSVSPSASVFLMSLGETQPLVTAVMPLHLKGV